MAYPLLIREKALKLRRSGHSFSEISRQLHVSKSSISMWVGTVVLSPSASERLFKKVKFGQIMFANKIRRKTILREASYLQEARIALVNNPDYRKIMCAMLYWCEGNKSPKSVIFTNSDPMLVKTFLKLLRESFVLNEKRFHPCVHIHEYHSASRQLDFWSKITNISKRQFIKPYRKPNTGKRIREGYQGCLSLRYHDSDLARRLLATAKAFLENGGIGSIGKLPLSKRGFSGSNPDAPAFGSPERTYGAAMPANRVAKATTTGS